MSQPTSTLKERDVLAALRAKHAKNGNGDAGEYAFLIHVRDAAGFDAKRTIDAIAVSLWPSRGLVIDAFEVKVSRSDWQRELAQPAKAEVACRIADRFWIAAPPGVVQAGELPETWGLVEVTGRGLRTVKAAPLLHGGKTRGRPISRDLLVCLLRAAEGAIPKPEEGREVAPPEIQAAYARGREEGEASKQARVDEWRRIAKDAQQALVTFENATGIRMREGFGAALTGWQPARLEEVGKALRAVLEGDALVERAQQRLVEVAERLRNEADRIEQASRW